MLVLYTVNNQFSKVTIFVGGKKLTNMKKESLKLYDIPVKNGMPGLNYRVNIRNAIEY